MDKFIAITGGIGSGKSTALKILSELGYETLSADGIYAELLKDRGFVDLICAATETSPVVKNGEYSIDRKKIAEKVFADAEKLKKLNLLTHPAIMNEMKKRAERADGKVFAEVPLLFEGGFQNLFDGVIVLIRDDGKRFDAVALRDGKDAESVKKIAESQFDYSSVIPDAKTFVIKNVGDAGALAEKLREIVSRL